MSFVIIADDDDLIVDVIRTALEDRGYAVGRLSDGKRVKEVVEMKRPDVVILDCGMPDVSGIQALIEIRTSEKVYATPVLVLTARQSAADEEIAWSAGANDYLRKPFNTDELVARVEVLMGKSASAKARTPHRTPDQARARTREHADGSVFDPEVFANVRSVISAERLNRYLQDLDQQLMRLLTLPANSSKLESEAHKIVSQAALLGLTRMSNSARALEDACRGGRARLTALHQCRSAVGDIHRFAMPAARH